MHSIIKKLSVLISILLVSLVLSAGSVFADPVLEKPFAIFSGTFDYDYDNYK